MNGDGIVKRNMTWPIALALVVSAAIVHAAEPRSIMLWPDGAPGATGNQHKDKPKLVLHQPDQANGTAIVICPGGGYGHLAMGHEGNEIASWMNSLGITAFILDYRHQGKGYGHPAPLQDVQRAIRTVRSSAAEWDVSQDRIGVIGFSAGGHLASSAGTHFDDGHRNDADSIQRVGCRPDYMVLCYPVIAFDEPYTHRGSQRNLLGEHPTKDLTQQFSNEKQVTAETPPTFLFHTSEDTAVPPENSVQFYLALRRAKVPAELHIFERGRHGLGLADSQLGARQWPKLCEAWLRGRGLLPK